MNPLVLVIDEDQEIVNGLKRLLEAEGYRVVSAFNGELIKSIFLNDKPSLAIVNLRVPKELGLSIVKNVKAISPSVPVIGMTVYTESFNGHEAHDQGIDAYFSKPFDVDLFKNSVARLAKQ